MGESTPAGVAVMSRARGAEMTREVYSPPFIAAITASASTIAALVPPSITAVVYGAVGNVSIAGLFMAGGVARMRIGFGPVVFFFFFFPPPPRHPPAPPRPTPVAPPGAAPPLPLSLL